MEIKERIVRVVGQYAKQLRDGRSFDAIENLYLREDLSDGTVCTVPTTDERFVIGPIVTAFMLLVEGNSAFNGISVPIPTTRNIWPRSQMQKPRI